MAHYSAISLELESLKLRVSKSLNFTRVTLKRALSSEEAQQANSAIQRRSIAKQNKLKKSLQMSLFFYL